MNTLPDDVLLYIFNYLPLDDLYKVVGRVSRRFHKLRGYPLLLRRKCFLIVDRVTNRDRHRRAIEEYIDGFHRWHLLRLCNLDWNVACKLVKAMPHMSIFNIIIYTDNYHYNDLSLRGVAKFIRGWGLTLVRFGLWTQWTGVDLNVPQNRRDTIQLRKITIDINLHLIALQHLHVEVDQSAASMNLDLPILERLQRFTLLSASDDIQHAFPSLRKFAASNPNLKSLAINSINTNDCLDQFINLVSFKPELAGKFRDPVITSGYDPIQIDQLCTSTQSLTTILQSTNDQLVRNYIQSLQALAQFNPSEESTNSNPVSALLANPDSRRRSTFPSIQPISATTNPNNPLTTPTTNNLPITNATRVSCIRRVPPTNSEATPSTATSSWLLQHIRQTNNWAPGPSRAPESLTLRRLLLDELFNELGL